MDTRRTAKLMGEAMGLPPEAIRRAMPRSQVPLRLCQAYLALLVIGWVALQLVAEAHWATTVALYLPALVYGAPLVLLAPIAVICRDGRALLVCLAAALLVLGPGMGFHWPLRAPRATGGQAFRVMSWNVHAAERQRRNVLKEIARWRPDVLVLAEVPGREAGLRGDLRQRYPGWSFHSAGDMVLMSRFPIVETGGRELPGVSSRAIASATLDVHGQRLTVIGMHLSKAFSERSLNDGLEELSGMVEEVNVLRRSQLQAVMDVAEAAPGPLLLAGDFNTPPRGRLYRTLAGSLTDVFAARGRGWGHTFSRLQPLVRIDYVFARGLTPVDCQVGRGPGSDHRSVIADLRLP